jgi:cytochrome b561
MYSVAMGWLTLLVVIVMHIMCFVRRWDGERSIWAYSYYIFHCSAFLWITLALILGYHWSREQPQAPDTNEH